MRPADLLVVVEGPDRGRAFRLRGDTAIVGRGGHADVRLRDTHVSRRHLRVTRVGDRYRLEDLGSSNGTKCPPLVGPHERFRVGRTVLELRRSAKPARPDESTEILDTSPAPPAASRLLAVAVGAAAALWFCAPLLLLLG